jgi:hypothetical protein
MRNKKWVRLLAYVTGSVNQELLLQNEYLAAENRILGIVKLILKTEVQRKVTPKDLRQQGDGIRRDGQTSPARDHRSVVG